MLNWTSVIRAMFILRIIYLYIFFFPVFSLKLSLDFVTTQHPESFYEMWKKKKKKKRFNEYI